MGESDWILPVLGIGGLAIGAIMVLPSFMKNRDIGGPILSSEEDLTAAERYLAEQERNLEAKRKLRQLQYEEDFAQPYTFSNRLPLLVGAPDKDDDAYVITDEDFDKLDIGKKDRRFLNKQRKLRDAKLERVVYGDNSPFGTVPSYFVNTVSPYGQGPSHEFTRLSNPEGLSNTNTRTNTINLY